MKKIYFRLLGLVILVSFSYRIANSAEKVPKRYPEVKSAIIKYEISGVKKGTEVVYFDDWGRSEARYTKTTLSMMGMTKVKYFANITADQGKWLININIDKKIGSKMKNPMFDRYIGKSEKEMAKLIEDTMKAKGGVKAGLEKIAGKTCDVWVFEAANSKSCFWKGIILKKETGMGKMGMTIVATEINEAVSVPNDKFEIPTDVKIQIVDLSNVLRDMKHRF